MPGRLSRRVRGLFLTTMLAAALAFTTTPPAAAFDEAIAKAASDWLAVLDTGQRTEGTYAFDDDERFDWHYTPRSRDGVALRDMSPAQKGAALALLRATLSAKGVMKAEAIMALEAVLAEVEGSSLRYRDPENYLVTVFGEPGSYPWGWRFEGHHLSINVTLSSPRTVSVTPLFTGTNPARIPVGPRAGERVQGDEYNLGLELAQSLTEAQREAAIIGTGSLGNIVAGPGNAQRISTRAGVAVSALSDAQRSLLLRLIESYVGLARDEIGRPYMALVRDGLGESRFAWAGGMREGEAFYYRIHGPRILIEFDNTQNSANHIHALWRDPANDFGRNDLHRHYGTAPASHGHR